MGSPIPVNTKVLRQLASRVVDLVRVDAPKNAVELDYAKIENLTEKPGDLAMLLGIGNVTSPNLAHPYILTQVAKLLGYDTWNSANELLKKASVLVGFDIKASDNKYHVAIKSGTKPNSFTRKYSEELVALLKQMRDEEVQISTS